MAFETFDSRGCVLALEATEGMDALPTPLVNALQLINGRSGIQAEKLQRALDRPHFGAKPSRRIKVRGYIEGEVEMVGAATPGDPSPLSALFQIAGMAETSVAGPPLLMRYNVISRQIPSASAYFYHAGTLKKILGARANLSSITMEIGKFFTAKARIEGLCTTVTEAALPTNFDYSEYPAPDPFTTEVGELEIAGVAVDGLSVNVDFGNALGVRETTRRRIARISGREATFTARFYRPPHASLNVWDLWEHGDEFPIVATHGIGAGAGRGARMNLRAQIENIDETEDDKDYVLEVKGSLIPSDAGNDELSFEFGTLA